MDNQKLDLTKVKQSTVLGSEIVKLGDTPAVREMIRLQAKDNFCMTLDIISYHNMIILAPALTLKINLIVKNVKVK